MRNQDLYRRIMENVKVGLSKTLNEDFQFDDTEIADKIFELVRKDRQIQNVVKNANPNDWAIVIRGMAKLVKGKNIPENPEKIKNQVDLAAAIINRGIDSKLQEKLAEMTNEDVNYTSNFLAKQINNQYGEKKNAENAKEKQALTDGKQCEGKNCNEEDEMSENKHVSESRRFRAQGGFLKFLNENNLSLRPGKNQSVDEDLKSAAVGTALGAAALLGGGNGKANAAPTNAPVHNQETRINTPARKYSEAELKQIFPQAYKDRFADSQTWSRNRVKYEGILPNSNKVSFVGKNAAANGENPWFAITDRYLDTNLSNKTIAFNDVR